MNSNERSQCRTLWIAGVVSLLVFLFDIVTPLGVGNAVLYVVVLLVFLRAVHAKYLIGAACVFTLLTIVDYFVSPLGSVGWMAVLNRCYTIAAVWAAAVLLLRGRASIHHLAAIVDHSEDAIISKRLDGVIVSWNGGAQRLYGYEPEEAIGKHISLIIPQERSGEPDEFLDLLRKGGHVEHY
jgi:PAS domain-containing protein